MKTGKCGLCSKRFRLRDYHTEFEKNVCFSCRSYGKWLIRHCKKLETAAFVIEGVRQGVKSSILKINLV